MCYACFVVASTIALKSARLASHEDGEKFAAYLTPRTVALERHFDETFSNARAVT
jgi:hypothetical protein